MDWMVWGPPLTVAALGLAATLGYSRWSDPGTTSAADALTAEHEAAVEALRALEARKADFAPAVFASEREALVQRVAAAEAALTAPAPKADELVARLAAERDRVGKARFAAAVRKLESDDGLVPPVWRGFALGALAVGAVALVSGQLAGETRPRPGEPAMAEQRVDPRAHLEEQLAQLEQRVAANPKDVDALHMLTELSINADDLDRARAANAKALALDATDPDARVLGGVIDALGGDTEGGLGAIAAVLAENPQHLSALVYQGHLSLMVGRDELAVQSFERALAVEPGLPGIAQALERAKGDGGMVMASGTIELGSTAPIPPGAVLFVSLRPPQGGPPVAAKKLSAATFPLAFRLTAADAIAMGADPGALPTDLKLVARVDYDGDAFTREEGAPTSETDITRGQTSLVLTLQ